MKKRIFGYEIELRLNGLCKNLENELRFYPDIVPEEKCSHNVLIEFSTKPETETISSNPKIFGVTKRGFHQNLGYAVIEWDLSGLNNNSININFKILNSTKSVFKLGLRRFLSKGFEVFPENIGQIMHELVFIPLTMFFNDKALIHGSCLYHKSFNKTVIFGGTGGVGKTSALLELGKMKNWVFLSDDMVVIDRNGVIYPNYSYPKIYSYNTIGDKELEKSIMKRENLIGRIQWYFKKKRNPSSVRRRVSPDLLYQTSYYERKLNINLFLFRGVFQNDVKIEKVDSYCSSSMEENIIVPEYDSVFRYLKWYEYNQTALGKKCLVKFDSIITEYRNTYGNVFDFSDNFIVKVDSRINHNQFKQEIIDKTFKILEGNF